MEDRFSGGGQTTRRFISYRLLPEGKDHDEAEQKYALES
jgi:hypothetical protein